MSDATISASVQSLHSSMMQRVELQTLTLRTRDSIDLRVLRLDRMDSAISGNKWFKLKAGLEGLEDTRPLLSVGGPYSNHLHALAALGSRLNIPTYGLVRGHTLDTPTLRDARNWGMRLFPVSRANYRCKQEAEFIDSWRSRLGDFIFLPEGGSTANAAASCADIWKVEALRDWTPDRVYVPAGTGCTAAGLILGAPNRVEVSVVSALASMADLPERIGACLPNDSFKNWRVIDALPLAFGKLTPELCALQRQVCSDLELELDPLYTLRAFYILLRDLIRTGKGQRQKLLLVHTGGLQGLRGHQERIRRDSANFCGPLPV